MKTKSNQEMPSFAKLMSGKCPQRIYDNMKILLSRTTTSHALGELFILVNRIGFVLVRLMDIEYVEGDIQLTVINQETGLSHVLSHSLNIDIPDFALVKLDDILTIVETVK